MKLLELFDDTFVLAVETERPFGCFELCFSSNGVLDRAQESVKGVLWYTYDKTEAENEFWGLMMWHNKQGLA